MQARSFPISRRFDGRSVERPRASSEAGQELRGVELDLRAVLHGAAILPRQTQGRTDGRSQPGAGGTGAQLARDSSVRTWLRLGSMDRRDGARAVGETVSAAGGWACRCVYGTHGFLVQVEADCPVHGREARPGAWALQDQIDANNEQNSEAGFVALGLVMLVLALLTAGTIAVVGLSSSATNSTRVQQTQQADEAAAEGAVYVMLDRIREAPTATSMPPTAAAIDGSNVAHAVASYDVPSGLWTVTGTAGASSVTVVVRRAGSTLTRESWSQS